MPTQNTDIFNMNTPGIQYAGSGLTWTVAKGVSVGSGSSLGVYSNFANSKLVNKGTIYSNSNIGAFLQEDNTEVVNKKGGQISGVHGLTLGGNTVSNVEVRNDGDLIGTSGTGLYAIDISDFQASNTGEIYGPQAGIYIVVASALPKGSKIDNDGKIHSNQFGILTVTPANLAIRIVNREDGLIEGDDYAILATSGMLKVKNEGKMEGVFVSIAANANDTVINKGKIKGDAYLGPGDDVFKNKDGKAQMLFGQDGHDKFVAGASKDQIVFNTALNAATNVDAVKNFEPGKDQFYLDMTIFASLTGPGPLLANQFRKGAVAVDGDDYIVFHKASGSLFYDPDGSGGTAQTKFAEVDPGTKLSHNDFTVIS